MMLQVKEATHSNSAAKQACGLCGKADPNFKPPDELLPEVGSVAFWKVMRAMRSRGCTRPHSFIVKRGAITSRIHHSQLTLDSESIKINEPLELFMVALDTFDRDKPRAVVSQKGAVFAALKGKTVAGVVTSVAKYGVFVSSSGLPFCVKGLVHKSKLAGFNKVAALKRMKIGDPLFFCIDDFQPHTNSDRRIAGDWQVDCSQERAAYAEAYKMLEDAHANSNTLCATAVVAGRSHRDDSFLVEINLPTGSCFVARLKAGATDFHKGDRLQVVVNSVDWQGERPSAEVSLVARLP